MTRKERHIPSIYDKMAEWETNRRSFLRAAMVAGAASQIAWFTSCSKQLEKENNYLTAEQSTILKSILMIIFPEDGNGPSAEDLNSFGYIIWLFSDKYFPQEEKDFIKEGLDWADEQASSIYSKKYVELEQQQHESLVALFVSHSFGKKWMNVMVSLTLESLLLDPIYGGNVNEAGWKWLDHVPGLPRPSEENTFDAMLQKYKPTLAG